MLYKIYKRQLFVSTANMRCWALLQWPSLCIYIYPSSDLNSSTFWRFLSVLMIKSNQVVNKVGNSVYDFSSFFLFFFSWVLCIVRRRGTELNVKLVSHQTKISNDIRCWANSFSQIRIFASLIVVSRPMLHFIQFQHFWHFLIQFSHCSDQKKTNSHC